MNKWIVLVISFTLIACSKDDEQLEVNTVFNLEGVGERLNHAVIALHNSDTTFRLLYQIDLENDAIQFEVENGLDGTYELGLYLFYEGDLLEDFEEARGSIFYGKEAVFNIELGDLQKEINLSGPLGSSQNSDFLLQWSDRLFHSFDDEGYPSLTLSFPESPCEFDIHFIPDLVKVTPDYSYVDYFIYDESGGMQNLGFSECFNCDLYEHINSFEVEASQKPVCENTDWIMADTFIQILFGSETGDLVVFYQRWDENRGLVIPMEVDKGRMNLLEK